MRKVEAFIEVCPYSWRAGTQRHSYFLRILVNELPGVYETKEIALSLLGSYKSQEIHKIHQDSGKAYMCMLMTSGFSVFGPGRAGCCQLKYEFIPFQKAFLYLHEKACPSNVNESGIESTVIIRLRRRGAK